MIMASFQIDELDEVLNDIERDSSMESVTSENSVDTAVLIGINDVLVDGEIPNGRPKRGRKRKIPLQSREDRKRLYNNNQAHVNTKGKIVQEKIFDEDFVCACRKKCTNTVPVELRRRLFRQYWSMGTFAGRCVLLLKCVGRMEHSTNRTYSIFDQEVCKNALMKTLQINEGRLAVALHKYKYCDTFADCRGSTTGGKNAYPQTKKYDVRRHIGSFPKYVSHYTRLQTDSKFLSPRLNLAKMYRLYKRTTANPVSLSYYKRIFYKHFNLRFKTPKKDTCKKCDIYKVKVKEAVGLMRRILEYWHNEHLEQADSLQTQMKKDLEQSISDPDLESASYDMQKILECPKSPTSIVYYKRQLNLYNLGIHTGSTGKGLFNIWKETVASKGTQEVGSCLKKYINNIVKPVQRLILWADSCGGQNRSIRLVLMLILVLQQHATLKTISLRFLESGHTFLPNDSEFGDFECALKKKERLYTEEAYIKVMKSCRNYNKFEVNRMSSEDFFSVKKIEGLITNRKKDINKEKINWMETLEILLDKSHPTIIKMRRKLDDDFQTVNLAKAKGTCFELVELDQLWPNGRPLSQAKLDDLKELLQLVPEKYKAFYTFLGVALAREFDDDIDGFGEEVDFELEED